MAKKKVISRRKVFALYNNRDEILGTGTYEELGESFGFTDAILRHYASKRNSGAKFILIEIEKDKEE